MLKRVSFHFLVSFFLPFFLAFLFIFLFFLFFFRFFSFCKRSLHSGRSRVTRVNGRSQHRPTKVLEFVKLILRPQRWQKCKENDLQKIVYFDGMVLSGASPPTSSEYPSSRRGQYPAAGRVKKRRGKTIANSLLARVLVWEDSGPKPFRLHVAGGGQLISTTLIANLGHVEATCGAHGVFPQQRRVCNMSQD